MPKSPADPGKNPILPPCDYTSQVAFVCQGTLIVGDHSYPGGSNLPQPPGGTLPAMSFLGGHTWYGDVRVGSQHWEAQLNLSCPGDNPSGILTLAYSDATGTYIGDYTSSGTIMGAGLYHNPEVGVLPITQTISQL